MGTEEAGRGSLGMNMVPCGDACVGAGYQPSDLTLPSVIIFTAWGQVHQSQYFACHTVGTFSCFVRFSCFHLSQPIRFIPAVLYTPRPSTLVPLTLLGSTFPSFYNTITFQHTLQLSYHSPCSSEHHAGYRRKSCFDHSVHRRILST